MERATALQDTNIQKVQYMSIMARLTISHIIMPCLHKYIMQFITIDALTSVLWTYVIIPLE